MRREAIVVAALGASSLLVAAPSASAAGWSCEASAARAAVVNTPVAEPISANKGGLACRASRAVGSTGLPAPLTTSALAAETGITGASSNPGAQVASATGGLVDFGFKLLPDLPVKLPVDDVINAIPAVVVPLPALGSLPTPLPVPVATLPSQISVDIRPAVRAVVGSVLNGTDLVRVRSAVAYASGQCTNGSVALTGTHRVAGVTLLGQDLPLAGQLVEKTVELASGKSIDPSTLDVTQMVPTGVAPELMATLQPYIKTVLDTLPDIQLPATLAQIGIQQGQQLRQDGRLIQRALTLTVSIANQRLADAIVGEASVGSQDVVCGTNVAAAALQCTTRKLTLIDVFERNGKVALVGAADKKYVGKVVRIFVPHQRRYVASALVRKDGTFRTTAPLPARRLRGTNLARYQARVGKERSLRLKLQRRMVVRSVRVSGGKVRISGRVTRPLAAPARTITITQRISCTKSKVVARVRPNSDGTFAATVKAPPKQQAAVYRLGTKVRKTSKNPKTFPTFTLPRYVDLAQ